MTPTPILHNAIPIKIKQNYEKTNGRKKRDKIVTILKLKTHADHINAQ